MRPTLSPKDLASAIGVSESSIKRWADDGLLRFARTAGGHRRIAREEAIRFIRAQRLPLADATPLGLPEIATASLAGQGPAGETVDQLFELFDRGDSVRARGLMLAAYIQGASVAEICDHLMAPAMSRLGQMWQHTERGIHVEHRATDACILTLNQIRSFLPEAQVDMPVAVGGAPDDDIYLVPSLAAATVLSAEGINAINLGANTPLRSLQAAVNEYEPTLVWLSISVPPSQPGSFAEELDRLDANLGERRVKLIIGGRCARQIRLTPPHHAFITSTMSELVAFVRGAAGSAPGESDSNGRERRSDETIRR